MSREVVFPHSVSAQSRLESFTADCDNIGLPVGQRAALEIIPPTNLALLKNSTLNVSRAVGYPLAVWVAGEVVACTTVETVFAVGVTHLQDSTTPAIQQLLPYFTSNLLEEAIIRYPVLREVGPSTAGVCSNPSAVFDPWPGEGLPVGDLDSKRLGMSISTPVIGDATIVGHSVSVSIRMLSTHGHTHVPSVYS